MTVQKIGIIAQEGTHPAFVEGAYRVVDGLIHACGGEDKYQVFRVQNADAFVQPLIQSGIDQAGSRYTQRGFYQINAKPIIDGMLNYSNIHQDTEFIMVMRDSIYMNQMNFFFGVNSNSRSWSGKLLNTTIISTGKGSPFETDGITFQSILMHELGHRFGATDYQNRSPKELYTDPQLGTHCATPGCIMNSVESVERGKAVAQRRAIYCPGCLAAIKRGLSR